MAVGVAAVPVVIDGAEKTFPTCICINVHYIYIYIYAHPKFRLESEQVGALHMYILCLYAESVS